MLAPTRHRIENLCAQAKQQADTNPELGNKSTVGLLAQTQPLLRTLDLLLAEDDLLRSGTHDAVAEAALSCIFGFANKTENWREVVRLLDGLLPVAVGEAQRARIEEIRTTAASNLRADCCFYCGQHKPDPMQAAAVEMYGDVNRTPDYVLNQ